MSLQPGTLLIAHEDLQEYAYDRSIQLLLKHDDEGTIAVNITGGAMSEVLGFGGPVGDEIIHFLHKITPDNTVGHRVGDTDFAVQEIAKSNAGLVQKLSVLLSMPEVVEKMGEGIMLVGCTTWKPGELDAQVAQGSWAESKVPLGELMRLSVYERWDAATETADFPEPPPPTPPQATISPGKKRFSL